MKSKFIFLKIFGLVLCFLLVAPLLYAHDIEGELANLSPADAALVYLKLGFTHILPLGFDHILFILSLYLLSPKLKPVLLQATAFTIAHSITLGLSMYKVILPIPAIVEPIIAISIAYVALENIFSPELKKSRLVVVFIFGLIHGMGFASALRELGLPQNAYLSSVILFNVGVEFGQVFVILSAYLLFGKWFGNKPWYRQRIVIPLSVMIALIALYWTVQRVFF
ncbi:MAG: HupE/UreJ family protein [Ferruginibacter sp.]